MTVINLGYSFDPSIQTVIVMPRKMAEALIALEKGEDVLESEIEGLQEALEQSLDSFSYQIMNPTRTGEVDVTKL